MCTPHAVVQESTFAADPEQLQANRQSIAKILNPLIRN
jgi:hypothetical protein